MFKIAFTVDLSASQLLLPYFSTCHEAKRYVYVLQVYDLRGCDVSIWYQRQNESYCHLVMGTGPILLDMPAIRLHASSCSGENGNGWLKNIQKNDLTRAIQNNVRLQIQSEEEMQSNEFETVAAIARGIKVGCSRWLGTDREFRVVAQLGDTRIDVSSQDGLKDVAETRRLFFELLRKSQLDLIPPQFIGL